jgi:hypothetical protein
MLEESFDDPAKTIKVKVNVPFVSLSRVKLFERFWQRVVLDVIILGRKNYFMIKVYVKGRFTASKGRPCSLNPNRLSLELKIC